MNSENFICNSSFDPYAVILDWTTASFLSRDELLIVSAISE